MWGGGGVGERERWQMPASQRMARGARLAATHSTQQAGEEAGGRGGGGREGERGKASGTKRCIVPELAARPSLAEWSASVVPGKSGHATKPAIWPAIKVSTVTFLSSTSPPSSPTPFSPDPPVANSHLHSPRYLWSFKDVGSVLRPLPCSLCCQ